MIVEDRAQRVVPGRPERNPTGGTTATPGPSERNERLRAVLSGLLSSVLTPLQETYSEEQLQVAAAILHETRQILCREIYLVPDTPRADRQARGPQDANVRVMRVRVYPTPLCGRLGHSP